MIGGNVPVIAAPTHSLIGAFLAPDHTLTALPAAFLPGCYARESALRAGRWNSRLGAWNLTAARREQP